MFNKAVQRAARYTGLLRWLIHLADVRPPVLKIKKSPLSERIRYTRTETCSHLCELNYRYHTAEVSGFLFFSFHYSTIQFEYFSYYHTNYFC